MNDFILNFTNSDSDIGIMEVYHKLNKKQNCTFLTSGTTGDPKQICVSYDTLEKGAVVKNEYKDFVWGLTYDFSKIAGHQVILQCILNKNRIVNLIGKSNSEIESLIKKHNITHLSATPTFYRLLLNNNKFETIKQVTLGGEPVDESLILKIKNTFPNANITNIYALTEFGTLLTSNEHCFEINEKVQKYIKIIDNSIFVKQNEEFIDTGDLVEYISSTKFKIIGRDYSMINVGGIKINPIKVENLINTLKYVNNCRVFARKNSILGNVIEADVCLKEVVDINKIKADLSNIIQNKYELPFKINIVDSIQLNSNNKVLRK